MVNKTLTISPLEILLDVHNPRFIIQPGSSQDDLRLYLFENEEIKSLVESIINYGGLMPGERIIVIEENDRFIVLEGNRRVCACQVLLNPELIPEKFKGKIPAITEDVCSNIKNIEADLAINRESAYKVLAARHIAGIKRWETVSKHKFFANLFEGGKTIEEIEELTDEKSVKNRLQEYYLLKYALDLPVWTEEQKKDSLHLLNIKPDVFLRIMRLKGTKKKLGLSFDEKTLQPKTTLPKQTFNKAIELITTAAFVTKKINTRSQFKDVPGLEELLDKKSTVSKKLLKEQISLFPLNSPKDSSKESYSKDDDSKKNVVNTTNQASKKQIKSTKSIQKPIESPPIFFENLKCTVSKNDEYGNGILITANEIKNISKPTHLKQFPVATALLLRTLLEQTLKYHIKKMNKWDDLTKKGKNQDPGLQSIINFYNQHLKDLIPDSTYQRTFKGVFSNTGIKDSLDLVVHHTDLVRIDNQILKSLASAGLRAIIEYILTYNYQKNPGQN